MSQDVTPLQALILWALLARGGSCLQKDLKPAPKPKDRDPLVRAGLISVEKKNRLLILHVEDKGWLWAGQNMNADLSGRSNAGGAILRDLLQRLAAFISVRNIPLAELLAAGPQSPAIIDRSHAAPAMAPVDSAELRERIRAAFLKLSGGAYNGGVLLSNLRKELAGIDRPILDQALLAIAREESADLMQLDNRIDITDADRQAALMIGDEPRHLLWISK